MQTFEEMKTYVRFDADDAVLLRAMWPYVEPELGPITTAFYDRILEFDEARTVFSGPTQVRRLQATLKVWMAELFNGPWDQGYFDRRRRIGHKHVSVRLPHRYMFTAMEVLTEHLCEIAHDTYDDAQADRVCLAIRRITMLDLAVMTGTFLGEKERLRDADMASTILSHLPLATLLLDAQGGVRTATEAAATLCGLDPVGRDVRQVLPAALVEAAELDQRLADALLLGEPVEVRRVDASIEGVQRSFRVLITPLTTGAFATMLVIDEITKTLEDESRRRRHEALAEMGAMSALVAHELRNPLAGISGAVQAIAGSLDKDDRRQPVMVKVRDQIRRLDRMVRDLLTFSRPPTVQLVQVDLYATVASVCDLLASDLPANITLSYQGKGIAYADADLVHRIVLNLVQNAVACQAGQDRGAVRVVVSDGCVRVGDEGPGIPDTLRERLFEPFFTTKTTGTGLGLPISRNAAHAMDATLTLDEADGPGATFVLSLLSRADDDSLGV